MLKNFEKKEIINQPTIQKQKPKKNMAILRLQKDILNYQSQKISFVTLKFPNETLQTMHISIKPLQDSIYHNCQVSFQLNFPNTYPIDPPKIKCLNKIYHPNINYQGCICLPLVRQDYTPTVNLNMIICGLIFLMTFPNGQDALNPQIGDLMIKDYHKFKKIVEYTIQGRTLENKAYDKIKICDKKQEKEQKCTWKGRLTSLLTNFLGNEGQQTNKK